MHLLPERHGNHPFFNLFPLTVYWPLLLEYVPINTPRKKKNCTVHPSVCAYTCRYGLLKLSSLDPNPES